MEQAELIVCRDVSLGYEGQTVLSHLDLTVRCGDRSEEHTSELQSQR